jgi:HSP20 family protein
MKRDVPLFEPVKRISERLTDTVGHVASRFHEETPLRPDVLESPDEYLVIFDAPGATISDVQIWYEDGGIEVRVDRFRSYHDGYEMRFPGRGLALEGRATLPADARLDPEETEATLESDGILHVRLPKGEDGDTTDNDA